MRQRSEIVVVGAALNGLAVALALAGPQAVRPVSVVIVDAKDPRQFSTAAFDGRASAITASSKRMLEALGLWTAIAPDAQPINQIIVTDSNLDHPARPSLLHFGEAEMPGEPSAYLVENRHLYRILLDAILDAPGIRLIAPMAVERFEFGPGLARLTLTDGAAIACDLVIAADGRESPARKAANIKSFGWSYHQTGIVTAIGHELPHDGCAEEHFLPSGPFAILPLTGRRSSLVWTETDTVAAAMLKASDDEFLHQVSRRFGAHRGALSLVGPRHGYPLGLYLAQEFTAPRLALVGDAAHVVHPIAGLGLNLGLRDAAALAECIADAKHLGGDPGGGEVLERYARWRRFDTALTAVATDGLNRLFSNDIGALRLVRDAGLRMVDQASLLKRIFTREAAGESGQLPRLMRGEAV